MRLKHLQSYAQQLSQKEGWDSETIATRIAYLKSELDETIKEIESYNTSKDPEKRLNAQRNLGYELFDIIWNVADIANRYNIDLEEASHQKMELNKDRTFSECPPETILTENLKTLTTTEELELQTFFGRR